MAQKAKSKRVKGTHGGKREGAGHPAHEPTDATRLAVEEMALAGFSQERIAPCIGISVPTLQAYYRTELNNGENTKLANVAGALYKRAIAGSDTAAIFILKCRGKGQWRENKEMEDGIKSLVKRVIGVDEADI